MPCKQINKKTNVNSGADQEQDDIMTNPAYSELWQDGILQTELEITVGHRTLSDQILNMSNQFHILIGHDVRTFQRHN